MPEITLPIVSQRVIKETVEVEPPKEAPAEVSAAAIDPPLEVMSHKFKRPYSLPGNTWKIKPGNSEHALYITINNLTLNQGTVHEKTIPYEIFINSTHIEKFHWVLGFTRVISAFFRTGLDSRFLIDELKSVFDGMGGYRKPGGKFMISEVAEVGYVFEESLRRIGYIEADDSLVDKTLPEIKKFENEIAAVQAGQEIPNAQYCKKCNVKAVVRMDNCMTCVSCGDSKCG